MRPRQVCRGKRPRPHPESAGSPRFNEAPASLPGKAPSACWTSPGCGSFNEAPASLPGKGELDEEAWPQLFVLQ